uniref:Fibronectin type-III domain-containing protein n=1 Tax=Macrostomum lignano TaxID=282301 RepID=A0A1I8FJF4_9PLAT
WTAYELRVAVQKAGGFGDVITHLSNQLTRPLLIADPASRPSAAAAESQPSESQPAEAVLLLNWTSSAAEGADLLRFRVSSASKPDLLREAAFNSMRLLLSLAEAELLSLKLTVAVTAVANKSGLRQEGSEIVIAEQLQMPPGRPSVSLLPDRRAVEVSLTASSGSELLTAAATQTAGASLLLPTAAARTPAGAHRGSAAAEAVHQLLGGGGRRAVGPGLAAPEVRTLEDAPSQPQSVRLDDASSQLLCDWRAPSEPNGVIRNYSVAWGSLSFPDGAEIRVGAKEAAADTTRLPLEPPPLPGTSASAARGSDRAERRLPDGEAPAVSGGLQPLAVPGGPVRLSWKPLSPELGRGVVFEFELRLDGPGGCAAARRLNCSDCGRHRLQLQSEEARQRLEALTADCSAPVLVRTFKFGDASLSAEVAVSSEGASPSSLLPWTEYGASLWPVNLAGPGAAASASFRSPETRSGAVGGLRATPSEAEALVEFEEPAAAKRPAAGVRCAGAELILRLLQMLVLNSSSAPGCQLLNCSTDELLKELAAECGFALVNPLVAMQTGGPSNRLHPTHKELQLRSNSPQLEAAGGGGGGSMTIVVAVAVSVLVAMAIAAGLLGLCGTAGAAGTACRDF